MKNQKIRFLKNNDGSEYTGGVKHELPDGFGILTDSNLNEFKCEWSQGEIDGMAYICYKDRRQFIGNFIKGKKYGLGALSYNGKIYLGEFQESKRTGYGEVLEIALSKNSSRLNKDLSKRNHLDSDPRCFDMARDSDVIKEPLEFLEKVLAEEEKFGERKMDNSKSLVQSLLEFNFEKPGIIVHSKRGYFLNGRLKGYGEFMIPQKDYYYFGTFNDGNFEGSGVEKTSDDIYHGKFSTGLREGIGISENNPKESIFQGNWHKGMREGFGILKQRGTRYEGFFKRSKRHGYAKLIKPAKNYFFIGKFQRGSKSDFGKMEQNGDVYIGEYDRGKNNGFGYLKSVGKFTYIGEWKDGRKDGFGYEVTEFDEFKGEFLLGLRHGKGVLKIKGKVPISCVYLNGVLKEKTNENMSKILQMFTKEKIDAYFKSSNERIERVESIITNSKASLKSELSVVRKNFKEESELLDDKIRYFKKEFKGVVAGFKRLYQKFEQECIEQTPRSARIFSRRDRRPKAEANVESSFEWEPMKFTPSRLTKSQLMKKELSRSEFLELDGLQRKSSKNVHQFMKFKGGEKSQDMNKSRSKKSFNKSISPKKRKRSKKKRRKRLKSKKSKSSRSHSRSISKSNISDISQNNISELNEEARINNNSTNKAKFDTFFNQNMSLQVKPQLQIKPPPVTENHQPIVTIKERYIRRSCSVINKQKSPKKDRSTERKPSFAIDQQKNLQPNFSPPNVTKVRGKSTIEKGKKIYEVKTPKAKKEFQSPRNIICSTQKRNYEKYSLNKKSRIETIFGRVSQNSKPEEVISREISPLKERKIDTNQNTPLVNIENKENIGERMKKSFITSSIISAKKEKKFISPISKKSSVCNSNLSLFKRNPEFSAQKNINTSFIMNYSSRNNYNSISNQLASKKKEKPEKAIEENEVKFSGDFYLEIQGYHLITVVSDCIVAAGEKGVAVYYKVEGGYDKNPLYSFFNNSPICAMDKWLNRDLIVCYEELSEDLLIFDNKLELIKTIRTDKTPLNFKKSTINFEIVGNLAIISSKFSIKMVDLITSKSKTIQGFYDLKSSESIPIALISDLTSQKLIGYSKSMLTNNTYTHFLEDQRCLFSNRKIKDISDRFSLCHKVQCAKKLNNKYILLGGASTYGKGLERPFLLLATFDSSHVPISGSIIDDIENSTSITSIEIFKMSKIGKKYKVLGIGKGWIFVYLIENNIIFDVGRISVDSVMPPTSHFLKGELLYVKYPESNVISIFKIRMDSRQESEIESYRNLGKKFEIENLFLNSQKLLEERYMELSEDNKIHQFGDEDLENLKLFDLRIELDKRLSRNEERVLRKKIKGFYFKSSKGILKEISNEEIDKLMALEILNDGRILKVLGLRSNKILIGSYTLPLGRRNEIVYVEYNKKFDLVYFLTENGNLGIINIKENVVKIIENFEPDIRKKEVVGLISNESCDKIFVIFDPKGNTGRSCDLVIYDKNEGIFKHKFLHLLDESYDCEIDFYQEKIFVIGKKQNFSVLVCFNFDKDLLFIADFLKLNDDFRSVERIPGTNTLIMGAQSSIYFINFFEDNFSKLLNFSLKPGIIEEIFVYDFEIYCKMKYKDDKLNVIRFPFSDINISKNELLTKEKRTRMKNGKFEGMKVSDFKTSIKKRSSSKRKKSNKRESSLKKKQQERLEEYIKLSGVEETENSHLYSQNPNLMETKDLIENNYHLSPSKNKLRKYPLDYSYRQTNTITIEDQDNSTREKVVMQSIETNLLLNTYVPSNWNTLGQVSLKRKSSEDVKFMKAGPVNARLIHPSVRSFEFQFSPLGKDMITSPRSKSGIEYINSMRLSALNPNNGTGFKEKLWFREYFIEKYKGRVEKEFCKIEISGNGKLIYLLSRERDLYMIDLEKDENANLEDETWDLDCTKISTQKIYNFTCISEDICFAYCLKQSSIRIFKSAKLVNVFDSSSYFQSQKNFGSVGNTDVPLIEGDNTEIPRVFYTPSRTIIRSRVNSQYVNIVPEGSVERYGNQSEVSRFNTRYIGKEGGILWIEAKLGVRYTNFNERDQALQPGEMLKLWKIQVPVPPRKEDLGIRFVLDVPRISKIIGLAVSLSTKKQFLQILDTLHFSPKTVVLDEVRGLEGCTFFNAIFTNPSVKETYIILIGNKKIEDKTIGFMANFSLNNEYLRENGKKSDIFIDSNIELRNYLEFEEYRSFNNIKSYEEDQFFVCSNWDILLCEVSNGGSLKVLTVINNVSNGVIYDVFMFMDSLYVVGESDDCELFKRINFSRLRF